MSRWRRDQRAARQHPVRRPAASRRPGVWFAAGLAALTVLLTAAVIPATYRTWAPGSGWAALVRRRCRRPVAKVSCTARDRSWCRVLPAAAGINSAFQRMAPPWR